MEEISVIMETLLSGIAKFGWILVGGIMARQEWERRKDKVRLEDTYTKRETQEQINLRLKPIEITLDHINKNVEKQARDTEDSKHILKNLDTAMAVLQATLPKKKG